MPKTKKPGTRFSAFPAFQWVVSEAKLQGQLDDASGVIDGSGQLAEVSLLSRAVRQIGSVDVRCDDGTAVAVSHPKDWSIEKLEELRSELEVSLLSQKRVDREILDKRQIPALLPRSAYHIPAGIPIQRPSGNAEALRPEGLLRSQTG